VRHSRKGLLGPVIVLGILIALLAPGLPAFASQSFQQTVPNGTVIALAGTPHLWIGDDQGMLHWGGDTRALSGRFVNWGDTRQVSAEQLRSFRMGDPWLSAGLLKIGDPIYLVKWETSETQPRLFRIQTIPDVEIFGINGSNYGRYVMERAPWERQFPFNVDTLQRLELPPAVAPAATATSAAPAAPAATVTPTPSPLKARESSFRHLDNNGIETIIEVTGAPPGRRLMVKLDYEEWNCSPNCEGTTKGTWGPRDAGPADQTGKLLFKDEHGRYKSYTYTFTDISNNTVSITIGDDRGR
jgi:hypothetical protein